MPNPIRNNLDFEVCHDIIDADYSMKSMQSCHNYYEIGYTISGDRKVFMADHIHYLHPGLVGTTPMNVYLRTTPGSNSTYERILIKYKPAMAQDFISIAGQEAFDKINYSYVHSFAPDIQAQILAIMQEMHNIYNSWNDFSTVLLKGRLTHLLYIVHTMAIGGDNCLRFHNTNPIIMEALYYMENHYMTPLTLTQVAGHINVSREHLSRLFTEAVGITFSEYRNDIRLRHAMEYLRNTDFSINRISELSGFSNSNYMCDIFKKHYNLSPSQYRKNGS